MYTDIVFLDSWITCHNFSTLLLPYLLSLFKISSTVYWYTLYDKDILPESSTTYFSPIKSLEFHGESNITSLEISKAFDSVQYFSIFS